MNSTHLILTLFFLSILFFLTYLIKEKKCVVCGSYKRGLFRKFNEKDLVSSGLIDSKKIYVGKKLFGLKDEENIPVCKDCSFEIDRILKEKNLLKIPSEAKLFFSNETLKNVISVKVRKTDFKPLIFFLFSLFTYLGIGVYKDLNSLFSIIGLEGILVYLVSIIIYRYAEWEGFIGKKGIVMYQKYVNYSLFYNEIDWMRVKHYSVKKDVVRLYLWEWDLIQILFYLEFALPKDVESRSKLFDYLDKNKVPIGK